MSECADSENFVLGERESVGLIATASDQAIRGKQADRQTGKQQTGKQQTGKQQTGKQQTGE